jgi:hypothetical protein
VELLKMLRAEHKYQPDAINAAKALLEEREVSREDITAVDHYFLDLETRQNEKRKKQADRKHSVLSIFSPLVQPGEKVDLQTWLRLLLLFLSIQYAVSFYQTIKSFIQFLDCADCKAGFVTLLSFLSLGYVPVIFYLLWKKRPWGWILLFADTLFAFISKISFIYPFFKYRDIHHGDTTLFLLSILINAAFSYFLWTTNISSFFSVRPKTRRQTVIITLVLTGAYNLMLVAGIID